jgi:hypothetical protein
MKQLLCIALVLAVLGGCSKKKDDAPAASGTAPAASEPAAASDDKPLPAPADAPQACKDLDPINARLAACDKIEAGSKQHLIASWNKNVRGSLGHHATASAQAKKIIEDSCTTTINATKQLLDMKGCP